MDQTAHVAHTLPGELRLGAVALTVAELDRSVAFYQDVIGLQLHERGQDATAAMGVGAETLVVLHEDPVARRAGRHAGLFHLALLSPSREELARAVLRLNAARAPIDGASDHGVSEAFYLSDPDGNGIELYADRPREAWPAPTAQGMRISIFTAPLDVADLMATVAGEQPRRQAGPGLTVGHVHLQVGSIAAAQAFYVDLLGFELMVSLGSALFVAAGGYHHHLGVNVWGGEGLGPVPAHTVGLRWWTVVLPTAQDVAGVGDRLTAAGITWEAQDDGLLVRDPWGLGVRIVA